MHGRVSGSVLLAAMACGATVLGGCDDRSYRYQPPAPVPSMGRAACIPDPLTVPSTGADAPTIRIFGDAVVELPLGQPYADPGATAESIVDGDLGARILTRGLEGWDMGRVGDHLITYTVSSLDGTATSHASRLVRITDGQSYARQTARPLDATRAPFGYLEHLPVAYSAAGAPAFPLIIFNHGIGEAYDWDDQDADEFGRSPLLLDRLLRRGLPALLRTGEWDDGLPFIVLSPQRCSLDANRSVQYLHDFVDYARRTYRVDGAHIYMVGFSAGSYVTWEYTVGHGDVLAAAVHIGGGDSELHVCPLHIPAVWAFHARDDATVPLADDLQVIGTVNACGPPTRAKLTVLAHGGHLIDGDVLDGSAAGDAEPVHDPYDENLYAWLLRHDRLNAP